MQTKQIIIIGLFFVILLCFGGYMTRMYLTEKQAREQAEAITASVIQDVENNAAAEIKQSEIDIKRHKHNADSAFTAYQTLQLRYKRNQIKHEKKSNEIKDFTIYSRSAYLDSVLTSSGIR